MRIPLFAFILLLFVNASAALPVHSPEDAVKVNDILGKLRSDSLSTGQRLVSAATLLEGAGLDDYYLADSVADLRVNLESFTPIMFLNNVIALVNTSQKPGPVDFNTFEKEFVNIACRRGENKGFPSIMYHSSDWISDNVARGNITEITENFQPVIARTKSLDEMTRRRQDFAALSDSTTFETVRMIEMGFRTHRVPTLKKETIKRKDLVSELQNGDIVILVPNRDGIDYYDIGIVEITDGVPYLIHLSPQTKKVVREKDDVARYMSLITKHFQGYRILRLSSQ